jgi:hypothetical protein
MVITPDWPATGLLGAARVVFSVMVWEKLMLVARLMAMLAAEDVRAVTVPALPPANVCAPVFTAPRFVADASGNGAGRIPDISVSLPARKHICYSHHMSDRINTYSNASARWINNIPLFGDDLGDSVVLNALQATAVVHGGTAYPEALGGYPKSNVTFDMIDKMMVEFGGRCFSKAVWMGQSSTVWYKFTGKNNMESMVHLRLGTPLIGNWMTLQTFSLDPDFAVPLRSWMRLHTDTGAAAGSVYMLMASSGNASFRPLGQDAQAFIAENYEEKVVTAYERIKADLISNKPHGRLHIISGPAGTGKTWMLRSMLSTEGVLFIMVPQYSLPGLVDPTGVTALLDFRNQHPGKPIVLMLEDADDALAPRQTGSTGLISTLLNFGDGITGSVLKLHIVATTNALAQEFDEAVKRPGRLGTAIEVGPLPRRKANEVFQRLTNCDDEPFDQATTLAEVYQKATDGSWKGIDKGGGRRVGFGL